MQYCAVSTCELNNGTTMVKMFNIPRDVEENESWKEALQIRANQRFSGKICIKHFNRKDIIGIQRPRLRKGAIPFGPHVPNILKPYTIQIVQNNHDMNDMNEINQSQVCNEFNEGQKGTFDNIEGDEEVEDFIDDAKNLNEISENSQRKESIDFNLSEALKPSEQIDQNCNKCDCLQSEINCLKRKLHQMQADYTKKISIISEQLDETTKSF